MASEQHSHYNNPPFYRVVKKPRFVGGYKVSDYEVLQAICVSDGEIISETEIKKSK